MKRCIHAIAFAALAPFAAAQAPDHISRAELLAKIPALRQSAQKSGSAAIKLTDGSVRFTMLSFRSRSGGGEVHEHYADIFYILQGRATLLTGGSLVASAQSSKGEFHGTGLSDATRTELVPGDFVQIPAGMPHQLMLDSGQELAYYVIKVRER